MRSVSKSAIVIKPQSLCPDIQMASLPSCPHLLEDFKANSFEFKQTSVSASSGFTRFSQVFVPAGSAAEAELRAVESSSLSSGSRGARACASIRPPPRCSHTPHSRWFLIKENTESDFQLFECDEEPVK